MALFDAQRGSECLMTPDVTPSPTSINQPASLAGHLSPQEMNGDQLHQWEIDGKAIPRPESLDADADSSSAEPAAQVASTEALSSPNSELGKPEKRKGKGLDARAQELLADRARERERAERAERTADDYRQRLEALEKPKQDARQDSSPAVDQPTDADYKRYRAMPGAPKASEFEDLDDYAAAMGYFIANHVAKDSFGRLFDERTQQSEAQYEQERRFESMAHGAADLMDAEKASDPEIIDRIDPRWKALPALTMLPPGQAPTPAQFIKDRAIFHSRHPLKVSEALTREDSAELRRLARLSPDLIIREVAYLDASFSGSHDEVGGSMPSVHVSRAPAPSQTLGRKAAGAVDPLKKAIAENDYLSFERIENERAVARKKR